jgi:hypothetical protein
MISSILYRLLILVFVGWCMIFASRLYDFLQGAGLEVNHPLPPLFDLIKHTVPSLVATSATATLEVFQVYQPVVIPSKGTNRTRLLNGSGDAKIVGQAVTEPTCEVLLMEHSFGYSYGVPFLGMSIGSLDGTLY